jgi:hypothetical protein
MESIVEGSARRLFRSRITAAEITRRLERAMEAQQTITVDRIIVPNVYRAYLHPDDFVAFEAIQFELEQEMGMYLLELAQERGFALLQHPSVDVAPNAATPRHTVQVEAETTAQGHAGSQGVYVGTQLMSPRQAQPVAALPPAVPPRAELVLRSPNGEQRFPLVDGATIGRGLDNAIVLDDARVSRRHAQLRTLNGRWVIADQQSTNGTFVNGMRVGEHPLHPGDVVSLGGLEVRFQQY